MTSVIPAWPAKQRIALVSTQRDWHGGEAQLALLAEGLRDRGHECLLLARDEGAFGPRMRERCFRVIDVPGRGRSPRAILKVRNAVKQFSPHVVHANDAHALSAAGMAGLGLRVPVRVAARRVDFPLKFAMRYRLFSDGLICVSNAVKQVCVASGLSPAMLHVVHDGVEPAFADSGDAGAGRHSLKLGDDQTLLLTVAKLTDHKGHAFLLRAIPDLIRQYPKLVFAFAGDGELRDRLVALAEELQIRSHVRFLGYRHDVPDLLAAANMVVQPSHLEGLCSSLIDAMLARKAIVATRAGGIPDLLQRQAAEKPVAWLAEPKSADSLAGTISVALRCSDERRLRGERARRRALQHFTANAMVEKTLTVYESIRQAKPHVQAASTRRSPAWSTV